MHYEETHNVIFLISLWNINARKVKVGSEIQSFSLVPTICVIPM
jgi:hypothetical protein